MGSISNIPSVNKVTARNYDHQNFWHLASIQSVSLGIGVIAIGGELAKKYGAGTAICSIIAGNFILWLIAIAVISMVDKTRSNAIDNISFYIGKYGGMLAACVLALSFLNWYSEQINISTSLLVHSYTYNASYGGAMLIKYGAGLGFITALFSIGGIHLLRKIASISLIPIFAYSLYAIFVSDVSLKLSGTWGLSFPAVLSVVLALLPGVINFPTFFRHSISKSHSIFSLSLIAFFVCFFEISTIWINIEQSTKSMHGLILFSIFIISTQVFCNFLNIYMASACWEAFVPRFEGRREYAILGLFGTLVFALIQIESLMQFLQDLTASYITTLGVVLLLAYLMRTLVRHRVRRLERATSTAALLFGWYLATIYEYKYFPDPTAPVLAGIAASLLFFLIVLFIEETSWAVKGKFAERKANVGSRDAR